MPTAESRAQSVVRALVRLRGASEYIVGMRRRSIVSGEQGNSHPASRTRAAILALLLGSSALLVMIWIVSYFGYFHAGAGLFSISRQVLLEATAGELRVSMRHQRRIPEPVRGTYDLHDWWILGYVYDAGVYLSDENGTFYHETHELIVPLWLLVATLAVWPFLTLVRRDLIPRYRRWREPRPGCCGKCGYNLTGNVSGNCPECGAYVESR